MSCSSLTESSSSGEENPHFAYTKAYFYHWSPGTPGPPGTNHIFKLLPKEGKEVTFKSVTLGDEKEEPDITQKGDTLVLMIQRRKNTGLPGGKGSEDKKEEEKKKAPRSASVLYQLDGEEHRLPFDSIPKKKRTTYYP